MSELITVSFWSGRTERYIVKSGTTQAIRIVSTQAGARVTDCIYRDTLPAGWYDTFYREHMYDKIQPWEHRNRYSDMVVLDRTSL